MPKEGCLHTFLRGGHRGVKSGSKTSKLRIGGSTASAACGMQGDKNGNKVICNITVFKRFWLY